MRGRAPAREVERLPVEVHVSAEAASRELAAEIAALMRARAAVGRMAVVGLPTGSSPVFLYRELVRLHREDGLSFANLVTFNLDEYYGLPREHPQSYWRFMHEHLFLHVDSRAEQVHIPDGNVPRARVEEWCRDYERRIVAAGGIDLQVLGIGRTGHIGFNEPGSARNSRTRLVTLDALTRRDAARHFPSETSVPCHAITMGVGTILEAGKIVLLAWGDAKASIVAGAVEGGATEKLPASLLQGHPDVRVLLDRSAAAELTRYRDSRAGER